MFFANYFDEKFLATLDSPGFWVPRSKHRGNFPHKTGAYFLASERRAPPPYDGTHLSQDHSIWEDYAKMDAKPAETCKPVEAKLQPKNRY